MLFQWGVERGALKQQLCVHAGEQIGLHRPGQNMSASAGAGAATGLRNPARSGKNPKDPLTAFYDKLQSRATPNKKENTL